MNCKSILILMILLSSFGCELRANRPEPQSSSRNVAVVLRPIEAVVHEPKGRLVDATETRIVPQAGPDGLIQKAQFINEQKGWASTSKSLFSTSDGGNSWRRLALEIPANSRLTSFFFIDDLRGWLVVTKDIDTARYGLGNASELLVTSDGGNTWKEQAKLSDEVRIKEISFVDANHGLAVGARIIDPPSDQGPPYEEIAAWRTDNGGEVWMEISETLKTALRSETNSTNDSGWNIRWLTSTQILLLTKYGRILDTSDGGTTWQTRATLKDERPNGTVSPTGYHKLIVDNEHNINVIAGAVGDEGYWGDLVVKGKDSSWASYELKLIPIFDGLLLSKDEVLLCGYEIKTAPVGVILHSTDNGRSWRPVYRSNSEEALISLSRVGSNRFYAVSDAGTLLRFSLPEAERN